MPSNKTKPRKIVVKTTEEPATVKQPEVTTKKQPDTIKTNKRLPGKKTLLVLVVVVLAAWLIISLGTGGKSSLTDSQVVEETSGLLQDLPTNETPTIATVEGIDALVARDGFYVGAQKGDKIIVYVKSGRALVYRPSTNQIIKDGDISTR